MEKHRKFEIKKVATGISFCFILSACGDVLYHTRRNYAEEKSISEAVQLLADTSRNGVMQKFQGTF